MRGGVIGQRSLRKINEDLSNNVVLKNESEAGLAAARANRNRLLGVVDEAGNLELLKPLATGDDAIAVSAMSGEEWKALRGMLSHYKTNAETRKEKRKGTPHSSHDLCTIPGGEMVIKAKGENVSRAELGLAGGSGKIKVKMGACGPYPASDASGDFRVIMPDINTVALPNETTLDALRRIFPAGTVNQTMVPVSTVLEDYRILQRDILTKKVSKGICKHLGLAGAEPREVHAKPIFTANTNELGPDGQPLRVLVDGHHKWATLKALKYLQDHEARIDGEPILDVDKTMPVNHINLPFVGVIETIFNKGAKTHKFDGSE